MLLSAARLEFGEDACSASDIMLLAPLVIADDGAREVQLLLTPTDGGDLDAELVSADADAVDDPGAWVVHMTARLSRSAPATPVRPVAVDAFRQAGRPVLDASSFYGHFWEHGYTLGPSFRWLHDGWTDGESVLRELKQPSLPDDPDAFQLYPGLIDTAFSVLGSGQADWLADIDGERINIPFAIDRIDLLAVPPAGATLYALASPQGEAPAGERPPEDIAVTDADGGVLARIVGFKVLKADRGGLKLAHRRSSRDLVYRLDWRSAPIAAMSGRLPIGRWLVGAGAAGTRSAVVAQVLGHMLESAGANEVVLLGAIDATTALALPAALTTYVDLAGLDDVGDPLDVAVAMAAAAIARATMLAQAAAAAPGVIRVVSAASNGPIGAATWALWRGLHAERPDIDVQAVAFADLTTPEVTALRLFRELVDATPLARSLWSGEERQVEWLKRVKTASAPTDPFAGGAPVLITGGGGGIGQAMAAWLLAAGVPRVVLALRGEPDEARHRDLAALAGAHAAVVDVVVADTTASDFADRIRAAFAGDTPPSHVFHLAGVTDDRLIERIDPAALARVLDPKLTGTVQAEAVAAECGAAFVAFSSMAALLPAPGQAVYAAANAFVDAFVADRRRAGRDARAIAWGPWRQIGMAARLGADFERAVLASGIDPLDPALAFDLLDQALRDDGDHLLVAAVDWSAFAAARPEWAGMGLIDALVASRVDTGQGGAGGGADEAFLAELAEASTVQRRQRLLAYLRPLVAAAVGLPSSAPIGERQRFFELGLDSLSATELRQTLQSALGLKLRATLIFDHPTIVDLADHLLGSLFGTVPAPAPIAGPEPMNTPDTTPNATTESSIAAMSDEEAHALLLKELE